MVGLKAAAVGGVLLITMASPALAFQCPGLVSTIDSALADATNLSTAQADEIKSLRDDGAAKHDYGDHGGAVVALNKALSKLGLSTGSSSGGSSYLGRDY